MFPPGPLPLGIVTRFPIIAVGGSVYDIAGYRVHQFDYGTPGPFQIIQAPGLVALEYLVQAGGAGAGYANGGSFGGGGGGGGCLEGTLMRGVGSYGVGVGTGGAGGGPSYPLGVNGSDSQFDTILAHGGGFGSHSMDGGGVYYGQQGGHGGCGGGTGFNNYGYGAGACIYPGEGGNGIEWNVGGTGGGGGGAGGNAPSSAGGAGRLSYITGQAVYYGSGGGGTGTSAPGVGYGGGGSSGYGGNFGGPGQGGVVIVRYPFP